MVGRVFMKSGVGRRTEAVKLSLLISIISIAAAAYGQVADCDSMEKCQEALKTNKSSSLVHFRIAEFYFRDKNFLSSANEFRRARPATSNPDGSKHVRI
jgi:hypothetical protein